MEIELIDSVIEKGKTIWDEHHKSTWHKYREIGQLIQSSGYEHGKWHSKARKRALKEWKIKPATFYRCIKTGNMNDKTFFHAMKNFTIYEYFSKTKETSDPKFPPLPEGKFRCLVIDPPWPMQKILREERILQEKELDYETLSLTQIEEDLGELIKKAAWEDGCHIYLWSTHKYIPNAFKILNSWDVKYQCLLTWVKPTGMTPFSWMYNTEHCLFGRIGSLKLLRDGVKLSFEERVREHSRKPEIFYNIVKRVSPGPRLNMFARGVREGFEAWGDEINKFKELQY